MAKAHPYAESNTPPSQLSLAPLVNDLFGGYVHCPLQSKTRPCTGVGSSSPRPNRQVLNRDLPTRPYRSRWPSMRAILSLGLNELILRRSRDQGLARLVRIASLVPSDVAEYHSESIASAVHCMLRSPIDLFVYVVPAS